MTFSQAALSLLAIALAGAPLVACAPTPTALSAKQPGRVFDARDGGDAAIALTVSLQANRRVQSLIQAYGAADVNHLVVSLAKFNGADFVAMLDSLGAPITVDLTGDELAASVTLASLRRNTTYQLQVKAYRNPGTAAQDLISLTDASSLATVTIGTDDAAQPLALRATLINRDVTVAFSGDAIATDGTLPGGAMQTQAAVAYSASAQRYMVAWRDDRLEAGHPSLYAQVRAADGTPIGAPILLSNGSLAVGAPAIAYDPGSATFLVVWASQTQPEDYAGAPGAYLLARTVSTSGTLASPFVVDAPPGESTQSAPTVAFSPADNAFVIAWQDDRNTPEVPDVMAKRIDAATMLPTGEAISVDASGVGATRRSDPALSGLSTGGFVVAWTDNALEHQTLRYRRLGLQANALVTLDPTMSLPSTASDQRHPSLAHDAATGETLLAWDDDRDADFELNPNPGRELYVQRLSSALTPIGTETALLTAADRAGDQDHPRVAFNAIAREYVLTWIDWSVPGGGEVFAGRRSSSGAAIGVKFPVAAGLAERTGVAIAHAGDAATNSSLLLWSQNGRLFHRVLDSRYPE